MPIYLNYFKACLFVQLYHRRIHILWFFMFVCHRDYGKNKWTNKCVKINTLVIWELLFLLFEHLFCLIDFENNKPVRLAFSFVELFPWDINSNLSKAFLQLIWSCSPAFIFIVIEESIKKKFNFEIHLCCVFCKSYAYLECANDTLGQMYQNCRRKPLVFIFLVCTQYSLWYRWVKCLLKSGACYGLELISRLHERLLKHRFKLFSNSRHFL